MDLKLNKVSDRKRDKLIKSFKKKYVNCSLLEEKILIWNSLSVMTKLCEFQDLSKIYIEKNKALYLFIDAYNCVFKLKYFEILEYLFNLEPWESIDGLIFDEELKWFIALTHDDIALKYGDIPVVARQL